MNIAEMICQTTQILTEIRKCQCMYHYCEDKKKIYNYIVSEICRLKKEEVLLYFVEEDFNENSSLEVLKIELLKLYRFLSGEFIHRIGNYNQVMQVAN